MREESHLDDMRSAIRGDFERLAERRGDQELMQVKDPDPPGLEGDHLLTPGESDAGSERAPETGRRSWLARFVSP